MSRAPLISVVVPSYNHGRFIEEALHSALQNTLATDLDVEVVIVDDGSSDDSVRRIEALAEPRIRLLTQANAGAHAALNRAVSESRGELISILNSDDAYEPRRLEQLLPCFDDPQTLQAASWLRVVDGEGAELAIKEGWHSLPPWPRPTPGAGLAEWADPALCLLETNYLATTSNIVFRRSLWTEHGLRFRNLRYAHDWCFFLEACLLGNLAVLEQPLVRYRVHGDNTIREGEDEGQAVMQFEILWLLARHAARLCLQAASRLKISVDELRRRTWASLPRFASEELLSQLLLWRGTHEVVPASYDALLEAEHPFRLQALAALRNET